MTNLILALAAALPLYAAYCMIRPAKACRRCGGWGSKPARRRRADRRHCRACHGTGRRFRRPARLVYRIRAIRHRQAELAVRAAERAAASPAGTERERVRS
jgi:hypothetical protein